MVVVMLSYHHHHHHGGDDDELTPRGPDAGLARAADEVESISWVCGRVWRVGGDGLGSTGSAWCVHASGSDDGPSAFSFAFGALMTVA